jgi:hypothetical protein
MKFNVLGIVLGILLAAAEVYAVCLVYNWFMPKLYGFNELTFFQVLAPMYLIRYVVDNKRKIEKIDPDDVLELFSYRLALAIVFCLVGFVIKLFI